jgi:hypothetical protein
MFEEATRHKFRFTSSQGDLSTEDLWDLQLTTTSQARASLNDIAISISKRLKAVPEEDFVNDAPKRDRILETKFEIVKHIIAVKKAEVLAAKTRAENKKRNEKIREIIDMKGDASLQRKSVKELEKMLAEE